MSHWGSPLERFLEKTAIPTDPQGCWVWIGGRKAAGYGQFAVAGKKRIAHRWAYQHYVGPIPEGLEIDHLCHNRSCVNPGHLEAVSLAENRARRNQRRTGCVNGHAYTAENTYLYTEKTTGYTTRMCRECRRAASGRAKRKMDE